MRILHTKAVQEPILLVSACPNMNLFAIATRSALTVYRSSTAASILHVPLPGAPQGEPHAPSALVTSACWSPTGRLLCVGFASSELRMFDVEISECVRGFAPRNGLSQRAADGAVPLMMPHTLHGAIVACTWASIAATVTPRTGGCGSRCSASGHEDRLVGEEAAIAAFTTASLGGAAADIQLPAPQDGSCLDPPQEHMSASIFEELEKSRPRLPLLLLLDEAGSISIIVGGLREVCVTQVFRGGPAQAAGACVAGEPLHLPPSQARCTQFVVEPLSQRAYLVVTQRSTTVAVPESSVVEIDLAAALVALRHPRVLRQCMIAEYCQIALARWEKVHAQWRALVGEQLHRAIGLPDGAGLLNDILLEGVARPDPAVVAAYFKSIDVEKLVALGEKLSQLLFQIMNDLSEVTYRCFDVAMALAVAESPCDATARRPLLDIISTLRSACTDFLAVTRREADHEAEILRWVLQKTLQRAVLASKTGPAGAAESVNVRLTNMPMGSFFLEPLRGEQHPSVLRSLHRIRAGQSTSGTTALLDRCVGASTAGHSDSRDAEDDEDAYHCLQKFLWQPAQHTSSTATVLPWPVGIATGSDGPAELPPPLLLVEVSLEGIDSGTATDKAEAASGVDVVVVVIAVTRGNAQTGHHDAARHQWTFSVRHAEEAPDAPPGPAALVPLMEPVEVERLVSPAASCDASSLDGLECLWFGVVDERRSLLVLRDAAVNQAAASAFQTTVALVGRDGVVEADDGDDGDYGDSSGNVDADDPTEAPLQHRALRTVKGMSAAATSADAAAAVAWHPVRASISRSRGFGIVVSREKYLVLDLID